MTKLEEFYGPLIEKNWIKCGYPTCASIRPYRPEGEAGCKSCPTQIFLQIQARIEREHLTWDDLSQEEIEMFQ